MLKKIVLALVLAIIAVFGYAALQPAEYHISRTTTINAPAEKIFPYLNSQKLAQKWGPWTEVDPQAKMELSGPESGVGARSSWVSPGHLGTGNATITESVPNQRVALRLEYLKPMSMVQDSEYLLSPAEGGMNVTWSVRGNNNVLGRVVCLFMNMDQRVGAMFEKGLSNLKALVEKG
jgi:uncharacterized protein YndB with AHSA1/START domain